MFSLYLELFAKLLLVIGGINYLFQSYNINLFKIIKTPFVRNMIYLSIGVSALYFIFNRDYYLPFLGKCAIPIESKKKLENTKNMKIAGLPPNTVVLVWGAQESNEIFKNPYEAYGKYENTVVTKSDEKGNVSVDLPCPAPYYVSKFGLIKRRIKRHIHYRYQLPNYDGLFSRVYTKNLDENCL
jgi:uncharacterized membrane protein YuzA (DUF378 family)